MEYTGGKRVYGIPVLDGEPCKTNVDFACNEDKSKITFYVANDESVNFIDKVAKGFNHTLHVQFGDSNERHLIFPKCHTQITRVDSEMESITTVELLITKVDTEKETEYFREL